MIRTSLPATGLGVGSRYGTPGTSRPLDSEQKLFLDRIVRIQLLPFGGKVSANI
jgi:hypothetical protein